jgi:glutathione S-transferase
MSSNSTLFFVAGTCSLHPRIIINETGFKCDFKSVTKDTKLTDDGINYVEINPKGSVPALITKDGYVLTESAVIAQYIAEETKSYGLLPQDGIERYKVLEMQNFIATDLHKSIGLLFSPQIPLDLKNGIFMPVIKKRLGYVNEILNDRHYIANDNFTIADSYLFVVLNWLSFLNVDISEFTKITQYMQNLKTRPSIEKSLKQENLIK